MKVEHLALQVPEPVLMAEWYVTHLGCSIARSGGEPAHARFLMTAGGAFMFEMYRNPTVSIPDYFALNPLWLHLAFLSEDIQRDQDRLLKAGATLVDGFN